MRASRGAGSWAAAGVFGLALVLGACGGGSSYDPGESTAALCQDGADNDGDGQTDCADGDCAGFVFCAPAREETAGACQDAVDNDGDGQTDCDDAGCQGFVFCAGFEGDAATCQDLVDNDGDGQTDCDDAGCAQVAGCLPPREDSPEACRNLVDDDADGRIDCLDVDCQGYTFCQAPRENDANLCSNTRDDDGDGRIDCQDTDCQGFVFCLPDTEASSDTCRNTLDDDGDGQTDCDDLDCQGYVFCYTTEETTAVTCQDLVDNDGDGGTDCDDSDCQGQVFCLVNTELTATRCQDGLDNDSDGQIDCDDPDCQGFTFCVTDETSAGACQDGLDNDGDTATDCDDADCAGYVFCQAVEDSASLCQNQLDDDGDGWRDCADPDCQGFVFCQSVESTAATCQDARDNDGDQLVDCADPDCLGFLFCFQAGEESSYDACRDGLDNDGDGALDCADEGCWPWGFCQHYHGFPVVDAWGETWDGIERAPRAQAEAEADCQALGGRLPTATELWRNHATGGSGDLSDTNATNYLWTRVLGAQAGRAVVVRLSDGGVSAQDLLSPSRYRCVWPDAAGAGFDEARCHGAPGAACHTFDRFWSVDRSDRAPLDHAAATNECAFYGASLPASSDWSRLVPGGLPNGTGAWLWVGKTLTWYDAGFGSPLVRWTSADAARWLFWQGGPGFASLDWATNPHAFRCIGLTDPAAFTAPAPQACHGACVPVAQRRSPVVADDTDRAPARISEAIADCRDEGADLPTLADLGELLHAGLPNGTGAWTWLVDPEYWYDGGYGQALARWSALGAPDWVFGPSTGGVSWGADARAYRCVWHAQGPAVPACPAAQVVVWQAGAFGCRDAVDGSSNGQAYVIEIVDDWGNAWDGIQRSALTYAEADAACQALGGRLPTASEIYAVRATGNPHDPIGDINATSFLWTSSPVVQAGERSVVRVSDGAASHAVEGVAQYFRCVWPSTRGDVLANRNCYGPPGDECFYTPDGLTLDRYDRPAVDVVTAGHECLRLGGQLPDHRQFAKLMHSGAPEGSGLHLWLDDFVYWHSGNYGYALGRWSGNAQADWEFDNGPRGGVGAGTDYRPFRCVHDRTLR